MQSNRCSSIALTRWKTLKQLLTHRQITIPPPTMAPHHAQDALQHRSLTDPESFWSEQAAQLSWHKTPSRALTKTTKTLANGKSHDHWEWFAGGEISTCYNCVDRHVEAGNGESLAIIWESPVTGGKTTYTYAQLLDEVEVFAGVLREEGVRRGDVVLLYSSSPLSTTYLLPSICCPDPISASRFKDSRFEIQDPN